MVRSQPWAKFTRPYLKKYPTQKRVGEVAQVVERLLSSNPSIAKKKKKEVKITGN
jgi:hypothetical protein